MKHILIVSTGAWDNYNEEVIGVYNKLEDAEKDKAYIESLRDKYKDKYISVEKTLDLTYTSEHDAILANNNVSLKAFNNALIFRDNFQVKIKPVYHNKFDLSQILNVNEL